MTNIQNRIRAYLYEQFPMAKARQIGDCDSLLSSGIIDSLGILDMVSFMENEFDIIFDDEDLLSESFETISALAELVQTKLSVRA